MSACLSNAQIILRLQILLHLTETGSNIAFPQFESYQLAYGRVRFNLASRM